MQTVEFYHGPFRKKIEIIRRFILKMSNQAYFGIRFYYTSHQIFHLFYPFFIIIDINDVDKTDTLLFINREIGQNHLFTFRGRKWILDIAFSLCRTQSQNHLLTLLQGQMDRLQMSKMERLKTSNKNEIVKCWLHSARKIFMNSSVTTEFFILRHNESHNLNNR